MPHFEPHNEAGWRQIKDLRLTDAASKVHSFAVRHPVQYAQEARRPRAAERAP
jgi:hypothetical protein